MCVCTMFRKKEALEIEMDDDAKSPKSSFGGRGAPPEGDKPSWASSGAGGGEEEEDVPSVIKPVPKGMLRVPRWTRVVHFSVHAFCALLIAILVIVLVCVELDAKDDGEDGAANSFLKPFRLNLDGSNAGATVCDQTFKTEEGTASSASSSGYVQSATAFLDIVETWSADMNEWDAYVTEDVTFIGADGRSRTLQEQKDYVAASRARRRASNSNSRSSNENNAAPAVKWSHEITGFLLDSSQVVCQSQFKRNGVVLTSVFSVTVFDLQSGKIAQHFWYPPLTFEMQRYENVRTMSSVWRFMFSPVTDEEFEASLSALDGAVAEDVELVQDNYYKLQGRETLKTVIRGLRMASIANPPKAHDYFFQNDIFTGGNGDDFHILDRYTLFNGSDANSALVTSGYSDYTFGYSLADYNLIKRQVAFEVEYLSTRGETALRFHNILNETLTATTASEKLAAIVQLKDIIDVDNWVWMTDQGMLVDFERIQGLFALSASNEYIDSFIDNTFSSDRYTEIEFMDAVYVMWNTYADTTPFMIHHFVPGTSLIANSFQSPYNMYQQASDGSIIDTANKELETVKTLLSYLSKSTYDSDPDLNAMKALVTDDFIADTYFGGMQTFEELRQTAASSDILTKHFANNDTVTILSQFYSGDKVVDHGEWRTPEGDVDYTFVTITGFEVFPEDPENRKISSFMSYKSTAVMNEDAP